MPTEVCGVTCVTVPDSAIRRMRWRIDAFDLVVLAAFLALSMWTVGLLVAQQTPQQSWTGTNGPYLGDQMQYLGWIRDSAQHVLIGNPFRTTEPPMITCIRVWSSLASSSALVSALGSRT